MSDRQCLLGTIKNNKGIYSQNNVQPNQIVRLLDSIFHNYHLNNAVLSLPTIKIDNGLNNVLISWKIPNMTNNYITKNYINS